MKKRLFFLIILCAVFLCYGINVHAEEKKIYEGEYINMYVKRHHSSNLDLAYYHMARIYREQGTYEEVFCVQPEVGTDENAIYYKNNPSNLSTNQMEMIKLLSYFGFNYSNHNTARWYMATQLLIWRTIDPNGYYYFTDTLNGNPTNNYDRELNEIYRLVNNYLTFPDISVPKVVKSKRQIELIDTNNILSNYTTNIGTIQGNKLILNNLSEGEHTITLKRTFEKNGREAAFYTSEASQNMYMRGDIDDIVINIKINVVNTSLKIAKKDKDNKYYDWTTLKGTSFLLTNNSTNKEYELKIDSNNKAYIDDLDFGIYTLKEIMTGTGYKLNNQEIIINIDENNPNIEIDFENEVIRKEVILHKTYGDHDFINEANITFEIYDCNNNLFETYTTDKDGYIRFTLPFGKYTLKQINTTKGYESIEPMELIIEDDNTLFMELKDYKISVPNTYYKQSILLIILKYIFLV